MTILVRFVLAVFLAVCCCAELPCTFGVEVRYELSDDALLNPERGFYEQFTARSEGEPLSLSELERLRKKNISLLLRLYYLEKFRDADLSSRQLDLIARDFRTIRDAGCKCILRFAYSGNLGQPDAPLDIVLKHITQLKPILEENADVIAVVQAGFIGAWGEWHGSTNNLETDEARRVIAGALLDALPVSRCIQVRTPGYKRTIVESDSPLTEQTAFSGTPQARIGHHNDCFLADETDVGTYDSRRIEWDKQYVALDTRYVPMGGETCQPSHLTEYAPARAELARMHWTYINRGFNRRVIRQWNENGLYAEAEKHLGYRLALASSDCDPTATAGAKWKVELKLKNLGWAAPINPREVRLVLKSIDGSAVRRLTLSADPRRWLPGEVIVVHTETTIPPDTPVGNYKVYLQLSDPDERLQGRIEYMIRLANQGLWDPQTGLHDLKQTVSVARKGQGIPEE